MSNQLFKIVTIHISAFFFLSIYIYAYYLLFFKLFKKYVYIIIIKKREHMKHNYLFLLLVEKFSYEKLYKELLCK